VPLLKKGLEDKNDYVRVSAVSALGKLDAPEAAALLERYVDDPNATLKQEAIYSIHSLSRGKRAELVFDKLYSARDPWTKLRGARATRSISPAISASARRCRRCSRCSRTETRACGRTRRSRSRAWITSRRTRRCSRRWTTSPKIASTPLPRCSVASRSPRRAH